MAAACRTSGVAWHNPSGLLFLLLRSWQEFDRFAAFAPMALKRVRGLLRGPAE
jgi:hypothetical protein